MISSIGRSSFPAFLNKFTEDSSDDEDDSDLSNAGQIVHDGLGSDEGGHTVERVVVNSNRRSSTGVGSSHAKQQYKKDLSLVSCDSLTEYHNLSKENADLRMSMEGKTREIRLLKREMNDMFTLGNIEETITSSMGKGVEGKVVELAKKARKLNVAFERERSLNTQLHNKLKKLAVEQPRATSRGVPGKEDLLAELTKTREKLAQQSRKLEQERIQNQTVRLELRNTRKALALEVGEENFSISKILETGGSLKGRTQHVALMKEKIRELSRQLERAKLSTADLHSVGTIEQEGSTGGSLRDPESRNKAFIRRFADERRQTMNKISAELENTKMDHKNLQKKHDAMMARNKILEQDMKTLKEKLGLLLQKTTNDDNLIQGLQTQIAKLKSNSASNGENPESVALVDLRNLTAEQEARIADQNDFITQLNQTLHKTQVEATRPGFHAGFTHGMRHPSAIEIEALRAELRASNIEISKLRELQRYSQQQSKTQEISTLQEEIRREKKRHSILEGTFSKDKKIKATDGEDLTEIQKLTIKLDMARYETEDLKVMLKKSQEIKDEELKAMHDVLAQVKKNFRQEVEISKLYNSES